MRKITYFFAVVLTLIFLFSCANGCDKKEHSHISEWKHDELTHWLVVTCSTSECDFNMPPPAAHVDGDDDGKCDVCGYVIPKHEHTYSNYSDEIGHGWSYTCGCMTPPNFAQHFDGDDDGKCDVCGWAIDGILPELGYSYLYEFENWIYNLTADNVKEIKTTTEFIGVAPGRFKNIQRTTDKDVIAKVISDYKSITMTLVSMEDAEVDGGGAFTIEFILEGGDTQKIYFNNGIYDGNVTKPELSSLQYYRVETIPTLEKYRNVKNSYSFITYRSTYELFTIDDEKVGEFYGLDKFEFVERGETEIPDGETAIPPEEPTHYIVGDVGTIYICSDKVFYMINDGQKIYYELVGKVDFSQLFNDSPANGSNDIFYVSSYPQDFEYNGRHYRFVQGVGLKTTVTQEELGELLGYIIREEDVSAFTQEYPNVDYVINNYIYDYYTNNRVAFYSVKAYPDLSLICMNQLGEYVLFQDV